MRSMRCRSALLSDYCSPRQSSLRKSLYLRRLIFSLSITFSFLLLSGHIQAQDNGFQSMKITFTDNSDTVLPLLESTEILVDSDSFVFQISDEEAWRYKFSEIKGFSYIATSVNAIEEVGNHSTDYILDGSLLTILAPAKMALLRIDGINAIPLTYIENDKTFDISAYVPGLYLLFVDGKTFKILKK